MVAARRLIDIRDAFRNGWDLESITAVQFDVVPDLEGFEFSEGGPQGWFVVAKNGF